MRLKALLVPILAIALAGSALAGDFVTNPGSTLPATKTNARPVTGDPTKTFSATDYNALREATLDLRDWVYAGHAHENAALTPLSVTASAASGANGFACSTNGCRLDLGTGATDYLYSDGSQARTAGAFVAGSSLGLSGSTGVVYNATSNASLNLRGNATNGASAVGVRIGNNGTLTTAGAQIAAFCADTPSTCATKVAHVDKDGTITANGGFVGNVTGNVTGNASTATALAANGTNCPGGQAPLGVDANGNAEGCFTPGASANPTGLVFAFVGTVCPTGALPADGAAVSRATYAALWALTSTAFGAGDGSTTFNVPDLRGRTVIGTGQGAGLTNRARNDSGGEESHVLSVAELPSHDHTSVSAIASPGDSPYGTTPGTVVNLVTGVGRGTHYAAMTSDTGSGTAHNTMQPFRALLYCIWY